MYAALDKGLEMFGYPVRVYPGIQRRILDDFFIAGGRWSLKLDSL